MGYNNGVFRQIKNFWSSKKIKQLIDPRNVALYIFALVVLAISSSGVNTIKTNYELQKKISTLKQQNEVLKLQNDNSALQNQYYQTDQYLELAARQDFGLAAPGEQVKLISQAVAMKYVDPSLNSNSSTAQKADTRSKYFKNLQAWRDFLLGHKASED